MLKEDFLLGDDKQRLRSFVRYKNPLSTHKKEMTTITLSRMNVKWKVMQQPSKGPNQ
jgi:hypothetical protein